MHSFSLPNGSPVTLDEMQVQLAKWDVAALLLLFKRHFGKDATLRIKDKIFATLADVRHMVHPDLPINFLEWDNLISAAEVNRVWAARNADKLRKAKLK